MKLLPPMPLPSLGAPPSMGMWSSDMLWRYPPAPPSPFFSDVKTALPPQISNDPRMWGRDDVAIFLRFCEREFDLPKFDMDLFQMNGKALCLLKRADLAERCPSAGDIVHNIIQMHMRESQMLQRHLPSSPVTPTSRYPLSPHSHPPTPNWSTLVPPESPFHTTHLQHFMATNSVTLSPAPSIDSQASSPPQHQESVQPFFIQNGTSSSSNQSDSEEESYLDSNKIQTIQTSPPPTPITKEAPSLSQQITNVGSSWPAQTHDVSLNQRNGNNTNSVNAASCSSSVVNTPTTPNAPGPFIPMNGLTDMPEPNTNGRLLWDFLQQLLNDPAQRYSKHIAWKCRDTGVFKIVDPAGLATLWGIQKNHLSMNYDKMSRALRYYYRVNILRKVQGERHCYQFLRNPTELKLIKTLSVLRQKTTTTANSSNNSLSSVGSTGMQQQHQKLNAIKVEPKIENDNTKPTDLSNNSNNNNISNNTSNNITIDSRNLNGKTGVPDCFSFLRNAATDLKSIKSLATSSHTNHHQSTNTNNLHHISTNTGPSQSSLPVISSAVTPHAKHKPSNLKLVAEHDIDDDMPTDLSTGGDRKYLNNSDSYPYIRTPTDLKNMKITSPLPQKPLTPTSSHLSHQHQLDQHLSSLSQPSTPPAHSFVHKQNFAAAMAAAVQSATVNQQHNLQQLKQRMETDEKDEKDEADQPVNGHHTNNDWRFGQDCYPLIRNSNGLTTIQFVRHNNENIVGGRNCSSSNRSPSPSTKTQPTPLTATTQTHHLQSIESTAKHDQSKIMSTDDD